MQKKPGHKLYLKRALNPLIEAVEEGKTVPVGMPVEEHMAPLGVWLMDWMWLSTPRERGTWECVVDDCRTLGASSSAIA